MQYSVEHGRVYTYTYTWRQTLLISQCYHVQQFQNSENRWKSGRSLDSVREHRDTKAMSADNADT